MRDLVEIDRQIEELQKERETAVKSSRLDALADVKTKIKTYKITPTELKGVLKAIRTRKNKVASTMLDKSTAAVPKVPAKTAAKASHPKKA